MQIVVGVADPALKSGRLGDFLMGAALGLDFERAIAERAVASLSTAQRVVALYEADQRFARAHLPTQLVFGGVRLASGRPEPLGRELIEALLSPDLFKAPRPPRAMFWRPPSAYREAAVSSEALLVAQMTRLARQQWSADLPAYDRALASRRYQVGIDCAEECELLDHRLRGRGGGRRGAGVA